MNKLNGHGEKQAAHRVDSTSHPPSRALVLVAAIGILLASCSSGEPLGKVGSAVTSPDCEVNPQACCPAGSTVIQLTQNDDNYSNIVANRCILALAGRDVVSSQTSGSSSVFGGSGDDNLTVTGPGTNLVYGGGGNDNIFATGTSIVVPGPGVDTLNTGNGNTTVYIYDLCEAPPGENLNGGGSADKLVTPVPVSQLRSRGVTVSGFETVVVQQNSCKSGCVARPDCSGHGQCAEGAMTGQVKCQCDVGWTGANCSIPELVTPIVNCVAELPGGALKAVWGYQNDQTVSLTVAVGSRNGFSPAPLDRGQPTVFARGNHPGVLITDLTAPLTWTLTSRTATATGNSPRCTLTPSGGVILVDLGDAGTIPIGTIPPATFSDAGLPPINQAGTPGADGGITPAPDAAPGQETCGPGLDLTSTQNGIDIQTRLVYPPGPINTTPGTPGCRVQYQQCDNGGAPRTPSEDELNQLPSPTDVCPAIAPRNPCGIDKETIVPGPLGLCSSDIECIPRGMVCALVCADTACQTSEHRCAKHFPSCSGLPEQTSCLMVTECPPSGFTGSSDPRDQHQMSNKPQSSLGSVPTAPPDLASPAKNPPLPATYPRGIICELRLPGTRPALPEQIDPRDANSGNNSWGVYVHPKVQFKASTDTVPIGGETEVDVQAEASFRAGAYVWSNDLKIIDAIGSANMTACNIVTKRAVTFLLQDVDLGVGGNGIDTTLGNPDSTDCGKRLNVDRFGLGNRMKKAYLDALAVKAYFEKSGRTQELCEKTFRHAMPPRDCTVPATQLEAVQSWMNTYIDRVNDFKTNQGALDADKQRISALLPTAPMNFLDFQKDFAFGPPEIQIPVGPATVVIDIEVSGFWGVSGDLTLGFARNPATKIDAKANVKPRLQATAFAFAGIGFGPVSFGVGGDLLLVDLQVLLTTGPEIRQRAVPDTRPIDFPGQPVAFPTNFYYWTADWAYGARADLDFLSGHIDLQARINLLFFHKTFRKQIAQWSGFHLPFEFVGGSFPLTGYPDFGPMGEEIAFQDPNWLAGSLVEPAVPVPSPVPGILDVDCTPPPP